jgi:ATP-binding cassette subfamily B protein
VENRATLVITHRLVRMEEMDEIVVLERGRIVGRGTHEELVNARGSYYQLLKIQRGEILAA